MKNQSPGKESSKVPYAKMAPLPAPDTQSVKRLSLVAVESSQSVVSAPLHSPKSPVSNSRRLEEEPCERPECQALQSKAEDLNAEIEELRTVKSILQCKNQSLRAKIQEAVDRLLHD